MDAGTSADESARERGRLAVVLATVVINVVAVSLLAFALVGLAHGCGIELGR